MAKWVIIRVIMAVLWLNGSLLGSLWLYTG